MENGQKLLNICAIKKKIRKAYEKCNIEIIYTGGKYFCVNRKDLEVESDYKNWAVIFDKCDPNKQKYRQKLIPDAKCQQCRVFVRNDLVEKMIKSCRLG